MCVDTNVIGDKNKSVKLSSFQLALANKSISEGNFSLIEKRSQFISVLKLDLFEVGVIAVTYDKQKKAIKSASTYSPHVDESITIPDGPKKVTKLLKQFRK